MAVLMADTDFALALQLQAEFDAEDSSNISSISSDEDAVIMLPTSESVGRNEAIQPFASTQSAGIGRADAQMSLVDASWDLIDPNPDARALFLDFNKKFFDGKLSCVEVRWSPRMTSCAGVCVYEGSGGLCSVRLSEPLLKLRPRKDLVETLLHEMIHAFLFVTDNNKDRDDHGPIFHSHMHRINKATGTNISVYHTFHDEVESYQQHWWRCDGVCRGRRPYFGYVKRAMNRAPSSNDRWWVDHVRDCGGTYVKIKEPEGFGEKKAKKSNEKLPVNGMKKLTDWLPFDKARANPVVTNRPVWIDIVSEPRKPTVLKPSSSPVIRTSSSFPDDNISDSELVSAMDSLESKADEDMDVFRSVFSPVKKESGIAVNSGFHRDSTNMDDQTGKFIGQGNILGSRSTDDRVLVSRRLPGFGEIPVRMSAKVPSKSSESASLESWAKPKSASDSRLLDQKSVNTNNNVFKLSPGGNSRFLAKAMATASQFISDAPRLEGLGNDQGKTSMNSSDSIIVSDVHSKIEQGRVLPNGKTEGSINDGKNATRKRMASASNNPVSALGSRPDIQQYLREANCPVGGTIRIPGFISISNPRWRELTGNVRTSLPSPTRSPRLSPAQPRPFKRQRVASTGSQSTPNTALPSGSSANNHEVLDITERVDMCRGAISDVLKEKRPILGSGAGVVEGQWTSSTRSSGVAAPYESMSVSDEETDTVSCPVCTVSIPAWRINEHLDTCLV